MSPGLVEVPCVAGRFLDHVQHDEPEIREVDPPLLPALVRLARRHRAVRQQVDHIIGQWGQVPRTGRLPFTPRSKKVLELSSDEARVLGHNYIGTGHILLALIRDGDGIAGQVLAGLGADLTRVRHLVTRVRGHQDEDEPRFAGAARRPSRAGRRKRKLLSEILGRLDSIESRLRAIEHSNLPPEP